MPKNKVDSKPAPHETETLDDRSTPPRAGDTCIVVGIGASAGGLDAFTQLLRALPTDTGMAFVLVQHLAATHTSILAEILSRETSMPVTEVTSDAKTKHRVEVNHVYVIPPGQAMTIADGNLLLFEREAKGQPRVIDQFFSSLAEDRGHLAIGVILSGTATDGTLGLEEIKAAGGITFAQDSTAQFDGMPRSAIDSGCIDYELSPTQIAEEIAHIASHPFVAFDANDEGDDTKQRKSDIAPILSVLQEAKGVDFTRYQPNTLHRRIKRRMILVKADGLKGYLRLLREKPAEVQALYQDVLINVTSFFRDPETFESLKTEVVPGLLKEHSGPDPLRIWVVGCSTGEEAYSLAILFTQVAESLKSQVRTQIFATDLNAANVDRARAGLYSRQRLQDMKPERIQRYFNEENGAYRVTKSIREMCVFATHNVINDPPFSRMDLVSCRNLLIYLNPAMQQRVLRTLHFSLNPTGCLMLGSSETVAQTQEFFGVLNGKQKLFSKKPGSWHPQQPMPLKADSRQNGKAPLDTLSDTGLSKPGERFNGLDVHREAERLLLAKFAPPGVLVNQELEILQFRGETDPYLTPAPGRASFNLLKMTREGLLIPLRAAIQKARKENGPVREERVPFKSIQGRRNVTLEVVPVKGRSTAEGGFLVLFEDDSPTPNSEASKSVPFEFEGESAEAQISRIEQELATTREYLQSVIEQEEATNEELQAANEEAQSSNEELQSINEELETSKEEIQSSNEELITVNDELQHRNTEVSQINNDLINLIGSVNTAIVMVGLDLSIRKFSPLAEKLLNIIQSDVGRPITNIRMNFELPNLDLLLLEAIKTVSPREIEVQDTHNHWFSLRIRPYVTLEKKVEGAVMMLIDVDEIRRARDYAESIVQTVHQPIVILDANLCIRTANRAFHDIFNIPIHESEGRLIFSVGGLSWDTPKLRRLLGNVLAKDCPFDNLLVSHKFGGIGKRMMLFRGRRLSAPGGDQPAILLAIEDVTKHRQDEAKLAAKEQLYREDLEASVAERTIELDSAIRELEGFNYTVAHDLRTPLRGIIFNSSLLLEELESSLTDDQRSMLNSQARNAKRLASLIDDLLKFSRLSRLAVTRKSIDVTELAMKVADESLHGERHHTCTFDIQGGMTCKADEGLFRMVITNLIENACKFSPDGGVITVGNTNTVDGATFFVKDHGIGFDMAYADQVFMPFERLHLIEEYPGTGIGLATVKRIVERHGGKVWVESKIGKGTSFYFTMAPGGKKGGQRTTKGASVPASS